MSLFNIFARLTLDSSAFEAGMKRAESSIASLGKTAARYFTAGAIGYGLWSLGKQAFNLGGEIADLSDQLGITTDEVQALQKAARESGIEFNKYAEAVVKVKKAKAEALSGNQKALDMFNILGVSPRAGILDILRAAGGAQSAEQLVAVFDLIGTKSGKIKSSLAEIKALGPAELISSENAATLDKAGDQIAQIKNDLLVIAAKAMEPTVGFYAQAISRANQINPRTGRPYGIGAAMYLTMAESMGDSSINRKYKALPLPEKDPFMFGEFNWGGATVNVKEGRRRRRLEREIEKIKEEGAGLSFRSSSFNDRASIGGFFIGADQTARMDLQRQQLTVQKTMADRIGKIEEQMRKLTEEE
jgi:hypothetical protein